MKKNIFMCAIFFCFFILSCESHLIKSLNLLYDFKIYNIAASKKIVILEHEENVNNQLIHYISLYDKETKNITKILSNNGEFVNSSMYYPSISDDGKFLVYTSRADNITDDYIGECFDITDGVMKKCSNIYLYNILEKKSILIKYENENFNGDNYIAKLSGNGNNVVFESIATNLVDDMYDCSSINGIERCINIYKYNRLTNKISLVSTNKSNNGGNANSVSPSISNDGRYIVYQSSSTNILSNQDFSKNCKNYISNDYEVCSHVFLVDTLNMQTKIISKNGDKIFNDNSGNALISGNGKFIVYESYASNITKQSKSHIYLYNVEKETNVLISKKDDVLNNRDNFIEDISDDGKYVIYKTNSTNLVNNGIINLYVVNINNGYVDKINETNYDVRISLFDEQNIIYYDGNNLVSSKVDNKIPVIEDNQEIYVLIDDVLSVIDKIVIKDNFSSREKINVYLNNIELLKNVGEHEIEVTAIGEFDNLTVKKVNIIVLKKDTEAPVFNEVEEIKILKGSSNLSLSNYLSAIDKVDGNTRIYIVDDGNLNLNITGKYIIKLMSKDQAENIAFKEIEVIVYENYNFKYFYEIIIILGIIGVVIFSIIKVK